MRWSRFPSDFLTTDLRLSGLDDVFHGTLPGRALATLRHFHAGAGACPGADAQEDGGHLSSSPEKGPVETLRTGLRPAAHSLLRL